MQELNAIELDMVGGGVSQSDVITTNLAVIGVGVTAAAAGLALAPFGAALFIGLSVGVTGMYIYEQIQ